MCEIIVLRDETFWKSQVEMRYIKMDHEEMGWEGVDWIHVTQNGAQWCALVTVVMNITVP